MTTKTIQLKGGKEESLKRFYPWIFSGATLRMNDGIEEGELVKVVTFNREFIAIGHYQIGSTAVRVLSFRDTIIDQKFWESGLKAASNMRIAIGIVDNPTNNTHRLVYGEGDLLPGLIVDYYGRTAIT